MKRYILILFIAICTFSLNSCLESYLDKAPESGLSEQDVFTKYENFIKFFYAVYEGEQLTGSGDQRDFGIKCGYPLFFDFRNDHFWSGMTDMSDAGRVKETQGVRNGRIGKYQGWTYFTGGVYYPILVPMFSSIRISNMALDKINMVKDISQEEKDDLIAQAHFVRAFAHFELMKCWGPMPYITHVIGPDDQWDIPRLSKHETLTRIALDFDTAAQFFEKAGKMRRDPAAPGAIGHLNAPDQWLPNGCTALGFKARALLYRASPLNNEKGAQDWQEAAVANWEAIQSAEQNGFFLLSAADYKKNFVGATYTDEQLWAWVPTPKAYNYYGCLFINGVFAGQKTSFSGENPTQNTIDRFETANGYPLRTQQERDLATSLGYYKEQDPYTNRDPRFYIDVIYNGAPLPAYGTAKIYYEVTSAGTVYAELLDQSYSGITKTGYYMRKRWGDQSVKNQVLCQYTDPLIRLGELYLNYAEAANEAYGPNTAAPNASMTAVQAINKIRQRVNMVNVLPQFTVSTDAFRPRVKNERFVELCMEGAHYYHDIRRWMDAPQVYQGPLMGVDIEKVPVSETYPTGFKYTRQPLPPDRQSVWYPHMYYWPFNEADDYKMKNFTPNPQW